MSKSLQGLPAESVHSSPLANAIDMSKQVTKDLERAADDLAVVHAVLDTKVARAENDEEVKRAIAETNEVEKRLVRSAENLDQVNGVLQREVTRAP